MTNLHDVQQEIARQLSNSSWFGADPNVDFTHAVLGIAEEAGELAGLCKRVHFRKKERADEEWMSEMGDVLWYLVAACHLKGFSLEDVWQYNCSKIEQRCTTGQKNGNSWEG